MTVQQSPIPTRKVLAGGLASLLGFFLMWGAHRWLQWDIAPEVATAIVSTVAGVVAYFVPAHARDVIETIDQDVRDLGNDTPPTA